MDPHYLFKPEDVQNVYSGPEGRLWSLIMGEQVHIGGLQSSMALAERAGIGAGTAGSGMTGIDLCCCTGAGMRFLVQLRGVAKMTGVDFTPQVIETGRRRCAEEGLDGRVQFIHADVCASGLPTADCDFVWGEDAWCYVEDKARLIAEAARLARPQGVIAFTDWMTGQQALSESESERLLRFMKFPNLQSLAGYRQALEASGCEVTVAEDTGRFAPCVDLYLNMLNMQLAYDAMRIIDFDWKLMDTMGGEMRFMRQLAQEGKLIQGMVIAHKK